MLDLIFAYALSRDKIAESPLRRLPKSERPKARNKTEARVLTDAQCEKLIDKAPKKYRALIATLVCTGLRIQECLGLVWDDVDLKSGTIHVRLQLSRATRNEPAKRIPLKTRAAVRDLKIAPELFDILRAHRQEAFSKRRASGVSSVFCTETGSPVYYRNAAARGLDVAADAAKVNKDGVQKLSFHDLRHTAISRWIAAGRDVVRVSVDAGHSNPAVTLRLYAREFEKTKNVDADGTQLPGLQRAARTSD